MGYDEVGKTDAREREGRERGGNSYGVGGKKGVQREVVVVSSKVVVVCRANQNRGRGREEGWKARQKEREGAGYSHHVTSEPADRQASRQAVGRAWMDGIVGRDDRSCMHACTQRKVRRARARTDVPAVDAGAQRRC